MTRLPSSITAIFSTAGATALKLSAVLYCVALLLALGESTVRPAFAIELNAGWNGGAGNWSAGANWNGGVVPNNSGEDSYNVFIDGGNPVVSTATLDTLSVAVRSLTIDAGDVLNQLDARRLIVDGGAAVNNGTWTLNTTGHPTDIGLYGGITLSGTGSIVMSNALFLANRILTDNTVVTQAAGPHHPRLGTTAPRQRRHDQ